MAQEHVVVVRRHLDAPAVRRLVETGCGVTLDLRRLVDVDLPTVEVLARLHLAAVRAGGQLRLVDVPAGLAELLGLSGLTRVLRG